LSYNKQLANGSELFGGIDSSYESKKYAQVHNGAYVGAYNLFGARFGIRMESGLTLTAYGKNLGDADEPDVVTRWLDNDYSRAFFSNKRRGRSIGVELKYDF
jgi:outer membrane receptor protein involved in Fe transport